MTVTDEWARDNVKTELPSDTFTGVLLGQKGYKKYCLYHSLRKLYFFSNSRSEEKARSTGMHVNLHTLRYYRLKCIFMDEDWRLKYFSLFSNNAYYEI